MRDRRDRGVSLAEQRETRRANPTIELVRKNNPTFCLNTNGVEAITPATKKAVLELNWSAR
jgi:hypothetical protein